MAVSASTSTIIASVVTCVIGGAAPVVTPVTRIIVGCGIADDSCGSDAREGQTRIDGLDRSPAGIVGGHAAHTGTNTSDQERNSGQAEQGGFRFHRGVDVNAVEIFREIFEKTELRGWVFYLNASSRPASSSAIISGSESVRATSFLKHSR